MTALITEAIALIESAAERIPCGNGATLAELRRIVDRLTELRVRAMPTTNELAALTTAASVLIVNQYYETARLLIQYRDRVTAETSCQPQPLPATPGRSGISTTAATTESWCRS